MKYRRTLRPAWLALAALLATAATAPAQNARTSTVTDADIAQLKPGQYIWAPALAPQGPMLMVVSLHAQQAYVYRNGVRIGASTVSTGKTGKATPTGVFTILQKRAKHFSNLYNNAPMPHMQRLTWDGIALHGGNLPGYPASAGCVRLPHSFAEQLFAATSLGMTVVITDAPSSPGRLDGGDLLVPVTAKGAPVGPGTGGRLRPDEPYRWTPAVSPSGPVTLVLSSAENRLVVLRNGKMIGRARVHIPAGTIVGDHVLELTGFDANRRTQWNYVAVPGAGKRAGQTFDKSVMQGVEAPRGFVEQVRTVLQPGATLLVTDAAILSGGAGRSMTVVDG
ncbi:MAG: L,D-transpeptidase [Sphingomonas sp.]|uniref:L,D-transpeptidase n=1 Tax=Sphingomonas sp. TaxID=28214 RepID=UPI001B0C0895|nr:L,D-transpeptidase [Sphingomonas sp.]MBO9622354.1 L,D-transpeptidase [Sphingomonas sp.]